MAGVTTDRRVRRTRHLLIEALIQLIIERGYEELSVQEILDRADVGRSTFYAHFRDKDDLLYATFERLRTVLGLPAAGDPLPDLATLSLTLFRHTDGQGALYRAMAGRPSGARLILFVHELLSEYVQRHLAHRGAEMPVPVEVAAQYYVSALLGLLTWWLDAPRGYSAEEMDAMFRRLVEPTLMSN